MSPLAPADHGLVDCPHRVHIPVGNSGRGRWVKATAIGPRDGAHHRTYSDLSEGHVHLAIHGSQHASPSWCEHNLFAARIRSSASTWCPAHSVDSGVEVFVIWCADSSKDDEGCTEVTPAYGAPSVQLDYGDRSIFKERPARLNSTTPGTPKKLSSSRSTIKRKSSLDCISSLVGIEIEVRVQLVIGLPVSSSQFF